MSATIKTADELHAEIMNIPAVPPKGANINQVLSYKIGHRDARHAAAELVLASLAAEQAELNLPSYHKGWDAAIESIGGVKSFLAAPSQPVGSALTNNLPGTYEGTSVDDGKSYRMVSEEALYAWRDEAVAATLAALTPEPAAPVPKAVRDFLFSEYNKDATTPKQIARQRRIGALLDSLDRKPK